MDLSARDPFSILLFFFQSPCTIFVYIAIVIVNNSLQIANCNLHMVKSEMVTIFQNNNKKDSGLIVIQASQKYCKIITDT